MDITKEQAERLQAAVAIISTRIGADLRGLVEQCVKDIQASSPETSFEDAASNVSQLIIATMLAQLRGEGCSETLRQQIMVGAIALAETLQVG